MMVWTGFISLIIGSNGRFLGTQ